MQENSEAIIIDKPTFSFRCWRFLGKLIFKLWGWKLDNNMPKDIQKCVVIAAPHTSNWDFVFAMAAFYQMNIKIRFLAKKGLFVWPLSGLLTSMGGIPVDRSKSGRKVESMVELFENTNSLMLLITAEGSRGYVKEWKSGFYYVALQARVPIIAGYLDYKNKIAGLGHSFLITSLYEHDLIEIKKYFKDKTPKFPHLSSIADFNS